jgi:hypothetical protein
MGNYREYREWGIGDRTRQVRKKGTREIIKGGRE